MKYIRLEKNIVAEIIPEFDPTFPNVPIEARYPAEFRRGLIEVENNVEVCAGMVYDTETGTFAYPERTIAVIDNLTDAITEKLEELSATCEAIIVSGTDVDGKHYSMTLADQLNLESLKTNIMGGAAAVPYHADNEPCALYTAADFLTVYNACAAHKIGHTTYFNQLKQYVRNLETIEAVLAVTYGDKLTGAYLDAYNAIMEALQSG